MLVYSLGDKGLFKTLIGRVVIIGVAGLDSPFIYYDFSAATVLWRGLNRLADITETFSIFHPSIPAWP